MSSEWELDEGIKSIKSAWRREHTARANLEKMLEQAEAENAKLRDDIKRLRSCLSDDAENARLLLGEVHELVVLANRLGMMFHECYCVEKDKAFCDGECPYGVDDETCEITKAMDVLEKYGRAQANE